MNEAKSIKDKKELDGFLSKVEEIESIINGLSSSDSEKAEISLKNADNYLKQFDRCNRIKEESKGFDRSEINHSAYEKSQETEQMAFMRSIEDDVKERTERKKENMEAAEKLKKSADAEFNNGSYCQALELYNQAITLVKDWIPLYTNRAQTHLQLGNNEAALSDCDWAFKVDPNSLNAFLIQAKVFRAMKRYDDAVECYMKAKACKPHRANIIEGNLAKLDEEKKLEMLQIKELNNAI